VGRWVDEEQVPSFEEKLDNVLQGVEMIISSRNSLKGL
jgi:hypothetical protein